MFFNFAFRLELILFYRYIVLFMPGLFAVNSVFTSITGFICQGLPR